jgi:hypothetical protein
MYECNRISLTRWVKLYNENNLISNHNKTKKSYKFSDYNITPQWLG